MYLKLPSIEEFNVWHTAVMARYGIPFQGTVAYTSPIESEVNPGVAFAVTDDLPDDLRAGTEPVETTLYFWIYGIEEPIDDLI